MLLRPLFISSLAITGLLVPNLTLAQYYDDSFLHPGYRGRNTQGITVTVSDSPDPAASGQTVTYVITIRNNFSSSERMTVSAIADAEILSASDDNYRSYDRVTWDRVSVPANGTKQLSIRIRAAKNTTKDSITLRIQAGGRVITEVTRIDANRMTGTTPPPEYPNQRQFDLLVGKQDVSDGVRYAITVGNRSNTTVHNAKITQVFHAPIRVIDILDTNGGVDRGERIEWDVGSLRPYEYRVFRPTVRFHGETPRSTITVESSDPVIHASASTSGSPRQKTNYYVPYSPQPKHYVYRAPEPLVPYDRSHGKVVYPQTGVIGDFFKKAAEDSGLLTPVRNQSALPLAAGIGTLIAVLGSVIGAKQYFL